MSEAPCFQNDLSLPGVGFEEKHFIARPPTNTLVVEESGKTMIEKLNRGTPSFFVRVTPPLFKWMYINSSDIDDLLPLRKPEIVNRNEILLSTNKLPRRVFDSVLSKYSKDLFSFSKFGHANIDFVGHTGNSKEIRIKNLVLWRSSKIKP